VHALEWTLKIPSNFSGVTAAVCQWPREDTNYQAAVGAACDSIRAVIRDLGIADAKTAQVVDDLSARQQQQEKQLVEQRGAIRSLQFALQGIITQYELEKLLGLSKDRPFLCFYSDDLYNEMKRLRAMALVANKDGVGLGTIRADYKDRNKQFDLSNSSTSPITVANIYAFAASFRRTNSRSSARKSPVTLMWDDRSHRPALVRRGSGAMQRDV
jgi:hypothetical protein